MKSLSIKGFKNSDFHIALYCTLNTKQRTTHSGIVFKDKNQVVFFHFGWYDTLYWENMDPEENIRILGLNIFSKELDEYRDLTDSFIAVSKTIYKKYGIIPHDELKYSLFYDDMISLDTDGSFNFSTSKSIGLTCSTFLMVLFKGFNHPLIIPKTWQARPKKDKEWKEFIINFMKRTCVPLSHIEKVKQENVTCRFKPEEVVSSAWQHPKASDYSFGKFKGKKIHKMLHHNI